MIAQKTYVTKARTEHNFQNLSAKNTNGSKRERQGCLDNLLKADDHCLGRTSWRCRHVSD